MNDKQLMLKTIELGLKGKGKTSPNPMVGALIVKKGRIIGEGWHKKCGGRHAEIEALRQCGKKAQGATLFVNLEPCYHYGRTPPCVDAVIAAGIKKVIIAMKDPNVKTGGKSIRKLRRCGIKVKVGLCETEAKAANEIFIKYMTEKLPYVVAKTAQTLDGKIAKRDGNSKWITQKSTREFARKKRGQFDAIMVGINTALKDNPRLDAHQKTKRLKKVVVDSRGRIPLNAKLFRGTLAHQCIVATTKNIPARKIQNLQKKGIEVFVAPRGNKVSLPWLFKELAKREITSILLEGGAHLIGSAFKAGLIDEWHVYIAPKIFDDDKALDAVVGININQMPALDIIEVKKFKKDLFLRSKIIKR